MDLVGACSLLLDVSYISDMTEGSHQGAGGVIAKASRAAKLGARAGRFTKIVKLLRFFLPQQQHADKHHVSVGTAKLIGAMLMARVSTQVSCLIIFMITLLPTISIIRYAEQDWSLQMWAAQLAHLAAQNARQSELDVLISDIRGFYTHMTYEPYGVRLAVQGVTDVLWQSRTPKRAENRVLVEEGPVTLAFNFGCAHRTEAAVNLCIVAMTIILMMGFSCLISNSVTQEALGPLEGILGKIRRCAFTIFRHVEHMQKQMHSRRSTVAADFMCSMNFASVEPGGTLEDDLTVETMLLERVITKIAALSAITMQLTKPQDQQTLQYLGQHEAKPILHDAAPRAEAELPMGRWHNSCQDNSERLKILKELGMGTWILDPLQLSAPQLLSVATASLSAPELDGAVLTRFVEEVAGRYLPGPQHHNWRHAVDVTHTLFTMLHACNSGSLTLLSWLEEYALLVSAVCHDIGHPGVSNDFLVQTSHDLAIRYNDTSPLENMHCATLFAIVQHPAMDVFMSLPQESRKEVRGICVEAILNTDNIHHVSHVKALQTFAEMKNELLQHARAVADHPEDDTAPAWPPLELVEALCEAESRHMLRNALLHLADISNPLKPFSICRAWAQCVLEEFFSQGDKLQELGLLVPALLDRKKTNRPFSQISFIEFFVAPCVFAMVRILAPLRCLQEEMVSNAFLWSEEWQVEMDPPGEEVQGVSSRLRRLDDRAALVRSSRLSQDGRPLRHETRKESEDLRLRARLAGGP
mmetsp:Transcript_132130/g.423257  ORF Transcript_132130/g.423257 Transcript_132130/m.423257 type:complete len:754 (-) Transcript_132130:20-2281(-)